jgi:hypothetical protein
MFTISGVPAPAVYWVKAFRDVSGNGVWDSWEPFGVCSPGAMAVKVTIADLQIVIGQTDEDRDGMPDEWERQIVDAATDDMFTSSFNVMPDADFDADGVSNVEEYRCGTSPIDGLSQPPRLRFECMEESVPGVATTLSVRLVLTAPSAWAVTAMVSRTGGSAEPGADFVLGDTVVAFAPAQTAAVVQVAICANAVGEPAEDLLLGVTRAAGSVVVGVPSTCRILITRDESDTDGDGLPDWWEVLYFSSPTAAVPIADPDGDGWDNAKEFSVGGHPGVPFVPDTGNVLQLDVTTPIK